jgi:hypothetical protein
MAESRCACSSIERKIFSTSHGSLVEKWFCATCGTEFAKVLPVRTYDQLLASIEENENEHTT